MATFKQYIYSSDGSAYNKGFEQQQGSIGTLLTSGLQLGVVSHIGIQAPPGTRFYLNGNTQNSVVVGFLGYVEIDYSGTSASITSIRFDTASIQIIQQNPNILLIMDTYSPQ